MIYTIIRPSAFLETHAYELLGKPVLENGKATIFGKGMARRNFIAVGDIVQLLALIWDDPAAANQTIEIGGPPENNLTNSEVAAMFEAVSGKKVKVTHVPRGVLRIISIKRLFADSRL